MAHWAYHTMRHVNASTTGIYSQRGYQISTVPIFYFVRKMFNFVFWFVAGRYFVVAQEMKVQWLLFVCIR